MDGERARPRFDEISTAFPTVPESVAAARRFVAVSLRRFGFDDGAIERAMQVTSELVANGFRMGRPPIRLRVRSIADDRAVVEVTHGTDRDDETETVDATGDDEQLHLTPAARTVVEALTERWGSRPSGTHMVAWFEIQDDSLALSNPPNPATSGPAAG
jgi:hypothetical protein